MKILMGAVIVLSMAAVTACGKKPEVVEEKNVESVHEEPEMADEQMTGSEHEETTESVDEEIAEITESARSYSPGKKETDNPHPYHTP